MSTIIYGEKGKNNEQKIFVNENDFKDALGDYKPIERTINELKRIETSEISGKPIPELFAYDKFSLWWFFFQPLYIDLSRTISFVVNFENFIKKTKPNLVQIKNGFEKLKIIEQICDKYKIPVTHSMSNFIKFKSRTKIKNSVTKRAIKVLTNKKINQRRKLFFQNKNEIPTIENKILFTSYPAYRRDQFNRHTNSITRGEHLLDDIKYFIGKKVDFVGIDLFSYIRDDDEKLKERLNETTKWIPVEAFFSGKEPDKINSFLKKFNSNIASEQFQNLFQYDEIKLWSQMSETFRHFTFEYYIPYWIQLTESIKEIFSREKPKAIFLPYEPTAKALSFIVAARPLNVKTISIQHGTQPFYHYNYFHDNYASLDNPYGFPLPDHMLLYGDIARENLLKKGYPEQKLVSFGHPTFFELDKIIEALDVNSLYKKFGLIDENDIILFTPPGFQEFFELQTQHNYNSQIWKYLLEAFKDRHEYTIVLKPHPRDDVKHYEKILKESKNKNAKIIQGNLIEILCLASLVISTNSTTIIDSMCLKKPVIQVTFPNIDFMMPWENYDAVLKTNLDELQKNIEKILKDEALKNELLLKESKFIKKYYNIPEQDPTKRLEELINS